MSDYDVNVAWKAERVTNVDDCLSSLLKNTNCFFRGADQPWKTIQSSLDLKIRDLKFQGNKLDLEKQLLVNFGKQCFRHLLPEARKDIELARLMCDTYRTTHTMFAGRHFGLPTRAVDWTGDPLTALFFACRRMPSKDGVVLAYGHSGIGKLCGRAVAESLRKEGAH